MSEIRRTVAIEHAGEKILIEVHVHLTQEEIERVVTPVVSASMLRQIRYGYSSAIGMAGTPPRLGTCWACLQVGTNLVWYGNHVIHDTDECKVLAKEKPETKEHRG